MSSLMDAVKANDRARVNELIEEGADVNALDSRGEAPLIMAAYKGYTDIARLLLGAGADVSALDPNMKATALHAAAYAGHAEAARLLIEHNIDIDRQGPYNGYTALHDAVWQNNVAVAQVLVEAGADLNVKSHEGRTPLEFARERGHHEIAELIERRLAASERSG